MIQKNVHPLSTNQYKSAFYHANDYLYIFIAADNCVQTFRYSRSNNTVLKLFLVFLPEAYKSPQIQVIKVQNNNLYCFSHIQSNNSVLSELFIYNLACLGQEDVTSDSIQRFVNTNLKLNRQVANFSINDNYVGIVSSLSDFYIFDILTCQQVLQKTRNTINGQILAIASFRDTSNNLFCYSQDDKIVIVNRKHEFYDIKPQDQEIIKSKTQGIEFKYINIQILNNYIYLVNVDGKTVILQFDGVVSKWQNIKENDHEAINCYITGTPSKTDLGDGGVINSTQIITFNKCLIKVNNRDTLKYRGKFDVGQTISQLRSQRLVNCYQYEDQVILITSKCHIQVLQFKYDENEKITTVKFQTSYQGLHDNDFIFVDNQVLAQNNKLLYCKNLDNNYIEIHENMAEKAKIQALSENQLLTVHKTSNCTNCSIIQPSGNQLSNNIFVSNSTSGSMSVKGSYCLSKYQINKKTYEYFISLEQINSEIVKISTICLQNGVDVISIQTCKQQLYILYCNKSSNQFVLRCVPNATSKLHFLNYQPESEEFQVVFMNINNDILYVPFNYESLVSGKFSQNFIHHFEQVSEVFCFRKINNVFFIGLIIVNQQSNVLESYIQVFQIRQLLRQCHQEDKAAGQQGQNHLRLVDIMMLNRSSNYDAMPVNAEINQFIDYSTCFVAVQYQKCIKIMSALCHETLFTLFNIGQIFFTNTYFIVNLADSFQVYFINEDALQDSAFYQYLSTDCANYGDYTADGYDQVVQQMVDVMYGDGARLRAEQLLSRSNINMDNLRSKITDQQCSVILSQLKSQLESDSLRLSGGPGDRPLLAGSANRLSETDADALRQSISSSIKTRLLEKFEDARGSRPSQPAAEAEADAGADADADAEAEARDAGGRPARPGKDRKRERRKRRGKGGGEDLALEDDFAVAEPAAAPQAGGRPQLVVEQPEDDKIFQKVQREVYAGPGQPGDAAQSGDHSEAQRGESKQSSKIVVSPPSDRNGAAQLPPTSTPQPNNPPTYPSIASPRSMNTSQLNQSVSMQLLAGLQLINQNLQHTVRVYEVNQTEHDDKDLQRNKEMIKKEVKLLTNTLDRINTLLGIDGSDSIQSQLKNLQETILELTKK